MIEADRADHSRAKLDHDLIVPITSQAGLSDTICWAYMAYRPGQARPGLAITRPAGLG